MAEVYSDAMSEDDFIVESDSDFSDDENIAPIFVKKGRGKAPVTSAAPASKKAPARKKAVAAPKKKTTKKGMAMSVDSYEDDEPSRGALAEIDDNVSTATSTDSSASTGTKKKESKKTVEEVYQKKSQLEHILLRPDTYSKLCLQSILVY